MGLAPPSARTAPPAGAAGRRRTARASRCRSRAAGAVARRAQPLLGRPTGLRTADQVEAGGETLPWALRERDRSYNIDGKALWLQFDAVEHAASSAGTSQLASSGIDRVQLFYRGADGRWVAQEAGDSKPVSQWPLPGRFPTFELSPAAAKPVRYWLRVEHARVDFASPIAHLRASRRCWPRANASSSCWAPTSAWRR